MATIISRGGSCQTTDAATAVEAFRIALPASGNAVAGLLTVSIVRPSDNTANCASRIVCGYNNGGTLTGNKTDVATEFGNIGASTFSPGLIDTSGTDLIIAVRGIAATTLDWKATFEGIANF